MSKSLMKLLDNALLPAALMVVSKFIGIVLTISLFNIDWSIQQTPNNIFSFQTVLNASDVVIVTSYSDLIMFLILALGFSINVFRAIYLHNSHIKVDVLNKLNNLNLLTLIESSYELYHAATAWLFFMWVAAFMIANNALSNTIYPWIGIVSLAVGMLLTIIFFQDVYKEVEEARQHPGKYLNA